ncbi:MAG: 50S ribosomal protein L9 [Mesoaciditoga sp.]|uniref:50S ribosomal protein L9 n=1 Tax=Athalassotoga sp. TaxID=2022597 RepID=UPI000CAE79B0|nr:MAG: 50S ribosomal protein L9 [Mesoaciditoga sp.]PMP80658.1 MAG: 50S ribosomal protein L9 [Mesoaciditoga sp.]HEU24109.1 50S ribosomal protein L9 [Mesoaciditoga lauensis]
MKVLLLQDVKALGRMGEIVEVSDGYARNYLLPRKLATLANEKVIEQVNKEKKAEELRKKKAMEEASKKISELMKTTIVVKAKAGEGNKLYGSVTSSEIAEKLSEYFGEPFDKKNIELEPIKELGLYEAKVKFGNGLSGKVKIRVEKS